MDLENCLLAVQKNKRMDLAINFLEEIARMNYRFTALLIILLCLLAIFVRPTQHTPLKIDSKNIIIPPPKPKHE